MIDSGAVGVMSPTRASSALRSTRWGSAPTTRVATHARHRNPGRPRRGWARPRRSARLHPEAGYDRVVPLQELARPSSPGDGFGRRRGRHDPPVDDTRRFSLASACAAADDDETLARWVGDFLASHGSDNEVLGAALAQDRHWWLGPVLVPIDELNRLAGPEDEALCPIEPDEWEGEVDAMEESLDDGWEPPPLLARAPGRSAPTAGRQPPLRGAGARRRDARVDADLVRRPGRP